jgi:D-alanyl-D-alanine carboxypeptidase
LAALVVSLALLASQGAAAGPSLVFEPATGQVISQERAGEPWYPASLTKLMTAYLVFGKLKAGTLKLDQRIAVSPTAAKQPPSKLGTPAGSTVTVDVALQSLLVYSANDMAVVLAEAASGSASSFVREMNETARRLGMTGSHFANPNGLFDERQVVTARDMGLLVSAILRDYPEHNHFFSQQYIKLGKRRLMNRNNLIRQMKTADGMKTGFICNSGFNLVGSATENGRRLVAIVFGASTPQRRVDLTQFLLQSSFARPMAAATPLATIANAKLGTLVPADMTETVCKGKNAVNMAQSTDLGGWGFSLGRYETAQLANMALRGHMLGARDLMEGGMGGVVKVPKIDGYTAMVWDLDQATSQNVCNTFKAQKIYCDVMTPEGLAAVGTLIAVKAPQTANGDAAAPAKKKTKKKKKRKAKP